MLRPVIDSVTRLARDADTEVKCAASRAAGALAAGELVGQVPQGTALSPLVSLMTALLGPDQFSDVQRQQMQVRHTYHVHAHAHARGEECVRVPPPHTPMRRCTHPYAHDTCRCKWRGHAARKPPHAHPGTCTRAQAHGEVRARATPTPTRASTPTSTKRRTHACMHLIIGGTSCQASPGACEAKATKTRQGASTSAFGLSPGTRQTALMLLPAPSSPETTATVKPKP